MIQKDHIIVIAGEKRDTGITAFRRIDLKSGPFEQVYKYRKVHGGIIHHQHPCLGRRELFMVVGLFDQRAPEGFLEISDGLPFHNLLRQLKGEDRAFSVFALNLQMASHHVKKPLDDGHAKSRTLDAAVLFFINALKCDEETVQILRLDPDAGVRDTECEENRIRLIRSFMGMCGEGDGSLIGIFDGV